MGTESLPRLHILLTAARGARPIKMQGASGEPGNVNPPDEARLIGEAQRGSAVAFEELVRRYDSGVLRLALRIVRSEEEAREIYQEAFLRTFRTIGEFRGECSFGTWLYRIVTNLCRDRARRHGPSDLRRGLRRRKKGPTGGPTRTRKWGGMMLCDKYREPIVLMIHGELEGAERLDLEAHLLDCPTCSAALEEERRLIGLLARTPDEGPSPELLRRCRDDLRSALGEGTAAGRGSRTAPASRSWRLRLSPA